MFIVSLGALGSLMSHGGAPDVLGKKNTSQVWVDGHQSFYLKSKFDRPKRCIKTLRF